LAHPKNCEIVKNVSIDPILAEVHAIKDAISLEFNHDVSALCRYLQVGESGTVGPERATSTARTADPARRRPIHGRRKAAAEVS